MRVFLLGLLLAAFPASAQVVWSGGAGNNLWSDGGNWFGGVPPTSASTTNVEFGISGATFLPNVDALWTVHDLTTTAGYAISGQQLTFDGAGAAISFTGSGATISNPILLGVQTALSSDGTATLSGGLAGAGSGFTKIGTGQVTLSGTTMYNGQTTILDGTLTFGDGATGPGIVFDILNASIAEFNVPSGIAINSVMPTSPGAVLVSGGTAAGVFGPMQYTGPTTVATGAQFDASIAASSGLALDGTFNTGDATFGQLTGGATGQLNINSGTFTTGGNNASTTFSGCIGGFGDLVKVGTGRLTLAVTCMHNGVVRINGGFLRFGDGATGPGTVFDIVNNAAVEFNVPGGIAINSVMNGTGSVTVVGGIAGGVFGPMQYTGATMVAAGGQFDAFVDQSSSLALDGIFNTGGATFGQLTGATTGQLNINSGTFTTGGDNASTTFNGCIGGSGDLVKVGTGRLTLAVTCMHNGVTRVNAGILAFGNGVMGPGTVFDIVNAAAVEFNVPAGVSINSTMAGSTGSLTVVGGIAGGVFGPLAYTGPTTVNAGARFFGSVTGSSSMTLNGQFDTGDATFGQLLGGATGLFNVNGGSATVGSNGANTTFAGNIASVGNFFKVGTGTLTLSGANALAGPTMINGGAIALTGSMAGPIGVASGATLMGTGNAAGGVTVFAGGTLSPGLSPGQINVAGLILAGNLLQEIEGATLGTQYDNVNVTGTVNLTGGTLTLAGAFVPTAGQVFTIITNDGADAVIGTFAGLPEGASIPFNTMDLVISYIGGTGNDVVLTARAAPAPASAQIPTLSEWMLALLAGVLLLAGACRLRRA